MDVKFDPTLREEHTLKVYEGKMLRKMSDSRRHKTRRPLHIEELHNMYSSPNIITIQDRQGMGGETGMHTGFQWENQKEKDH
jgi:hypothetical protein